MSHFFGLGPEYKLGIHQEIFSLCYHGQGGFTWGEVIQEKNKANDDAAKSRTSSPNISKPPTPRR
jgi:hypothetical protein